MSDPDVRALERSLAQSDTPGTRLRLAQELERVGRLRRAVEVLAPVARRKDADPEVRAAFFSTREALWRQDPPAGLDWSWRAGTFRGVVGTTSDRIVWRQRELGRGAAASGSPDELVLEQRFSAFSDDGPPAPCRVPWRILTDLVAIFDAGTAEWFHRDRAKLQAFGAKAERAARDQVDCEVCSGRGEVLAGSLVDPVGPETCSNCSGAGFTRR